MSFKRWLTSVLCSCILLSSILVVPVSAVDDNDYYSAPAVSDGSVSAAPASLGGIMLASATSWDTNDRAILQGIYKFIQYMTTAPSSYSDGSVIGLLHRILNKSGSSGSVPNANTNFRLIGGDGTNDFLNNIYRFVSGDNISGNLGNIQRNTLASSERALSIYTSLTSLYDHVASETSLSKISKYFNDGYVAWYPLDANGNPILSSEYGFAEGSIGQFISTSKFNMTIDGYIKNQGYTVFHYLKNLSDVLAPEDDKKLSQAQKENREQVENDFLTGKTGKTSLGKDDFGSLSSVGGTFKDTISLNGQSSIGDLTSGLSDADTVGQGWFSQATKDSLDAVSGSSSSQSTVSTFSDDGLSSVDVDSDPYHMQGFEDNYAWLWGDD